LPVTVGCIVDFLKTLAPAELAAPWDNSGFLCGDAKKPVTKILVTLDITRAVAEEAAQADVQMIVAHHPLFLEPLRRIVAQDYPGSLVLQLIQQDIAVFAAHTNLDHAAGGVNDVLAEALGLQNIAPLAVSDPENPGRIGSLPQALDWPELIALVKDALRISYVKGVPQEGPFQTIAVCGGGGIDLWPAAQKAGADCLISADGKHHQGLEAREMGMALIDGGHFATEHVIVPVLAAKLRKQYQKAGLTIIESMVNTCAWHVL